MVSHCDFHLYFPNDSVNEHFFMCLLAICIPLEKKSVQILNPFLSWVICLGYWVCKSSWCTLDADTLQTHELHIFVVASTCLPVSSAAQRFVIFKVCIYLATSALCCGAQPLLPCDVWELSSLTRDRTRIPCPGRQILNQWTTGQVRKGFLFWFCPIYPFPHPFACGFLFFGFFWHI